MSFQGYLLKPNGVILPNKYIDVDSYKAKPVVRRVIDSGFRGNGKYYEKYSPHTTAEISFSTNGLIESKMRAFLDYFPTNENCSIEFYDFGSDAYYTKLFKIEDFEFTLYKIRGNSMIYKSLPIVMKSY